METKMLSEMNTRLEGYCCVLTEITEDDADFIVKIRTDKELNSLSEGLIDRETHLAWFERYKKKNNDIYWIIREKNSMKPIGTTALYDIDFASKKAENGRTIILYDFRYLTFDVFFTWMSFVFESISLNKTYGKVRTSNSKLMDFYTKKLGFKTDGLLRQDWWNGREYIDLYLISMLREEFMEYKKTRYVKYIKQIEMLVNRV